MEVLDEFFAGVLRVNRILFEYRGYYKIVHFILTLISCLLASQIHFTRNGHLCKICVLDDFARFHRNHFLLLKSSAAYVC